MADGGQGMIDKGMKLAQLAVDADGRNEWETARSLYAQAIEYVSSVVGCLFWLSHNPIWGVPSRSPARVCEALSHPPLFCSYPCAIVLCKRAGAATCTSLTDVVLVRFRVRGG
jgi:hypothetical protein